jgi:hypothetical protein
LENYFNFNVKLDAMKWKKVSQWQAGKARKAGKELSPRLDGPALLREFNPG